MFKIKEIEINKTEIWRVFISGSSSAGKTYFAKQLLKAQFFRFDRVLYFHPDLQESFPTDWKNDFSVPVIYQAGLPTEDELLSIPAYTCLVFDDVYTMACESKLIDYLFRVLSSKKRLHCIIMTQRYFAEGSNGLNIRNSSNFHVLMNNADERTNLRVANTMNLRKEVNLAIDSNKNQLYPYIFIDRTNFARVNELQIYIDIFSRFKKAIYNSMIVYLINEHDFKANFDLIDNNIAVHNGQHSKTKLRTKDTSCDSKTNETDDGNNSASNETGNGNNSASTETDASKSNEGARSLKSRFHQRKKLEREIKRALQRYNFKTQL